MISALPRFEAHAIQWIDQIYCQAGISPVNAGAAASNPKQSPTLPVGTVAPGKAAKICHLDGLAASSGQAMKPVAPKALVE